MYYKMSGVMEKKYMLWILLIVVLLLIVAGYGTYKYTKKHKKSRK